MAGIIRVAKRVARGHRLDALGRAPRHVLAQRLAPVGPVPAVRVEEHERVRYIIDIDAARLHDPERIDLVPFVAARNAP